MDISKLLTYLPQLYNNVLCGDRKSIISRIYGSISNIHLSVVKPSGLSYVDLFSFEQKERRESLAMQIVCKETKNYYGSFCQNHLSGQLWQSGKFISDPVSNSFSS